MSLMRTLAKVALGVAVAKGVRSMASPGSRNVGSVPQGMRQQGGGLGSMLENLVGGGARTASPAAQPGTGTPYSGQRAGSGGGLDGMLGGLLGGGAAGGGLGGMLRQLADRADGKPAAGRHPFGEVLDSAQRAEKEDEALDASPEQEVAAGLMLRAMIQSAKADGRIDMEEQRRLMEHLSDLDPEERAFVQAEMEAPVDPEDLARQTPRGLETAVYAMSVMAIDVDTSAERDHLSRLANALGLERGEATRIEQGVAQQT